MTNLFNNKRWLAQMHRHVDPLLKRKTNSFIVENHPYEGRVLHWKVLEKMKFEGDEKLETLADYAEAQTIVCCELFGDWHMIDPEYGEISRIGNMAYIALHHSDPSVRKHYLDLISNWRIACLEKQ